MKTFWKGWVSCHVLFFFSFETKNIYKCASVGRMLETGEPKISVVHYSFHFSRRRRQQTRGARVPPSDIEAILLRSSSRSVSAAQSSYLFAMGGDMLN